MKKVLIPVQTGFQETELITTLDVFGRNGIDYLLWSVEGLDLVKSSHEGMVMTELIFPVDEEFDALFIPGGPSVKDLLDYDEILHIVKKFNEENKLIGAICSAPEVLLKTGVLEGKKYTSYEGCAESGNKIDNSVVVDGNIVTGKNYKSTIEFAETFVKELKK